MWWEVCCIRAGVACDIGGACRFPKNFNHREEEILQKYRMRAEIITELILERADPVIFKTSLLELIAVRLFPVISPARGSKPENYWKR